ncbi:HNH endonuclease [Enterococcus pallens]|uniref:HNH nuclease domain-containing protein n=1 Tax=Enterococcus pallens ATCC BAA-351 TaxID=1158607 RepID=R2SJ50_9ENTE|nr:HNH endonuclease signature motif containing protein [Enterococcus pallens]EOH95245.1 hypothetical protein UAU_01207 [Enterococcus pallens ATCC BAA-351]EOU21618.1 hypothetical protein I588_02465 [Enterococcus pallens ATCC BAA-351]OJG79772.1 hypothetical protein RV10_GL000560 [Enterococcus pallens]
MKWIFQQDIEIYDIRKSLENLRIIDVDRSDNNPNVYDIVYIIARSKEHLKVIAKTMVIPNRVPFKENRINDSIYWKTVPSISTKIIRLELLFLLENVLLRNISKRSSLIEIEDGFTCISEKSPKILSDLEAYILQKSSKLEIDPQMSQEKIDSTESLCLKQHEVESITKQRVTQGHFRSQLLRRSPECQICGIKYRQVLIASHIIPWTCSSDENKIDIENGLILCAQHDRLFDKGLITFNKDGYIQISSLISSSDYEKLQILDCQKLEVSKKMAENLDYHRQNIFLE